MFLRYHRAGRAIYAVGGNAEAARAAGINVDRVKIAVYVAGGALAAIGGIMEAGAFPPSPGNQGYQEGDHFHGVRRRSDRRGEPLGGKGNMVGVATGVALLSMVQNILDLANVSNYWIEAIDGAVILVALVIARIIGGKASQG